MCQKNDEYRTEKMLFQYGISREMIRKIISSGYICTESQGPEILLDTFYGITVPLKELMKNKRSELTVETKYVSSLYEAEDIIGKFKKNKRDNLLLTYRGMNHEYFLGQSQGRLISNPFAILADNKEPSFLPYYWRNNRDDSNIDKMEQVFRTLFISEILYFGIDIEEKVKENYKKGLTTMSDLEDDDNPVNREIYRRWQEKIYGEGECALIAQHYGLETRFLDITYDLAVALFFATHKYKVKDNGKATYIENINPDAAVYCFDFENQIKEDDIYKRARLFEHIKPERPLRQKATGYGVVLAPSDINHSGITEINHFGS